MIGSLNKIAVIFHRFGPYHIARLEAAAREIPILAIELSGHTSEYQWDKIGNSANLERITLFPEGDSRKMSGNVVFNVLTKVLNTHKPIAVAINGWSDKGAFTALYWCISQGVPAIAMSESGAEDASRSGWKEMLKRCIVRQFSAGLVGGSRHKQYLMALGIPETCIFTGYDVIDNRYFANEAAKAASQSQEARRRLRLPDQYFLTSNRFIEKKNLFRLIRAYGLYRQRAGGDCWDLVMLGDGELRKDIETLLNELNLREHVHLKGFQQYADLPAYYGLAGAFIHASTSEQWGLVVNEAMAAGLPVLVSDRCGCAPDVVENGMNGFTFDPYNTEELAMLMERMASDHTDREAMGRHSRRIMQGYMPESFAAGLQKAVQEDRSQAAKYGSWLAKGVLKAMIYA